MNSIELDFVLEDAHSFAGVPCTRQDILDQIRSYGLAYEILLENGPAGGNPLLELRGTREQIERYLTDVYVYDGQDLEFYIGMIK